MVDSAVLLLLLLLLLLRMFGVKDTVEGDTIDPKLIVVVEDVTLALSLFAERDFMDPPGGGGGGGL
jgi:hypothetical protein